MARRVKLTIERYAADLPEGVSLKRIDSTKSYRLLRTAGGTVIAERPEEVVFMWKNPERVFAYIVRRVSRPKPPTEENHG